MDKKRNRSMDDSGRKGRLDENTLGYYRRVSETIKDGIEDPEGKDAFLRNIFKQLSEELVKVSQNQTASGIVEELLNVAETEQLVLLVGPVSHSFEVMCCDKFASHVLQTMMVKIGCYTQGTSSDSEELQQLRHCMQNLWEFFKTSMGLYMQHTYASHVLRVMIEMMGGIKVSDSVVRSRVSNHFKKGSTPDSKALDESAIPNKDQLQELKNLYKDIVGFAKLSDYLENRMSNPVIQTVLLVLQRRLPKSCDKMCKKLLKHCFDDTADETGVGGLVTDSCGSHLVEQIFGVVSPEVFDQIFEKYIKGKMSSLAFHPVANFVLQKVIHVSHTKDQFETIFGELSGAIEDLMARNHLGVVVKLAEGCAKHGTKQEKFIKCLMKGFHCYKPMERQSKLVTLTACLTTYEVFYKVKEESSEESSDSDDDDTAIDVPLLKSVNYHGSLLLQKLLQFSNLKPIVSSFLELKVVELVSMSCDPCGSHVIDLFVTSDGIGEKNRNKLLKKLKDGYETLACSKNGSRTLDSIWGKATLKEKSSIAEELVKHSAKLRSDRVGHHIWRNFGLQLFTTRREQWKNFQVGKVKKRKMFEDIVSPHGKKRFRENNRKLNTNNGTSCDMKDTQMQNQEAQNDTEDFSKVRQTKQMVEQQQTVPKHLIKQNVMKRKRPKTTTKKKLLKASHPKT